MFPDADNNQIRVIEGLSKNRKLSVLSLGYNRIEKIENIGHLKELKRLSVGKQCVMKSAISWGRVVPSTFPFTSGNTWNRWLFRV